MRLLSKSTKCPSLLDRRMKEVILRPKKEQHEFLCRKLLMLSASHRTRHSYKYVYSGCGVPSPLFIVPLQSFQFCSYARYPRNFSTLYLCVRDLAFLYVPKLRPSPGHKCTSVVRPFSRHVVLLAYRRIHASDLSKQCVSILISSIESFMTLMYA